MMARFPPSREACLAIHRKRFHAEKQIRSRTPVRDDETAALSRTVCVTYWLFEINEVFHVDHIDLGPQGTGETPGEA